MPDHFERVGFQNAEKYALQFLNTLSRKLTQELVMQPFTDQLGDWIRGWWNPSPGADEGNVNNQYDPGPALGAEVQHMGGIIGHGRYHRQVPASLFIGAPRAHRGLDLRTGEVPVIARNDEVISRPGTTPAGGTSNVNLINNTSQQMAKPRLTVDPRRQIIDVVLSDYIQGGRTRDVLGG